MQKGFSKRIFIWNLFVNDEKNHYALTCAHTLFPGLENEVKNISNKFVEEVNSLNYALFNLDYDIAAIALPPPNKIHHENMIVSNYSWNEKQLNMNIKISEKETKISEESYYKLDIEIGISKSFISF